MGATGDEAVDGTGLSLQSADGTQTEMGASPAGITSPSLDAATAGVVNVYMEVKDEGVCAAMTAASLVGR